MSVASSSIGLIEATSEGLDVVITLYFRFDGTKTSYAAIDLQQKKGRGKTRFLALAYYYYTGLQAQRG